MRSSIRPTIIRRCITTYPTLLSSARIKNPPTNDTNINPTGNGCNISPNARAKPKIYNSNVTGSGLNTTSQLTDEQQVEVDKHNSSFAKNQSLGKREIVDDRFWKGNSKG